MKTIKSICCGAVAASLVLAAAAHAADMSSTNYRISWDVIDSGGGLSTSTSYVLVDSVGQPSPIGASASANYSLQAGFHSPPDSDGDIVRDFLDNCLLDPNANQRDTDMDGYGNLCDGDLDNSGTINFTDLNMMKMAFFSTPASPDWNEDADMDGDNSVNFGDLFLMKMGFFGPPGPSGIAP